MGELRELIPLAAGNKYTKTEMHANMIKLQKKMNLLANNIARVLQGEKPNGSAVKPVLDSIERVASEWMELQHHEHKYLSPTPQKTRGRKRKSADA